MPKPGIIQQAVNAADKPVVQPKQSINEVISSIIDRDGLRKRFDELLGARVPQFMSGLVTLINATPSLQQAFYDEPMTVIQCALKAASYDLPIDPGLGFAYIVPFRNGKTGKMEANFIMGYRGLIQLAMRAGVYKKLNVTDIRRGELISYDHITEDIVTKFIEDGTKRERAEVIGYVGYFRLVNGMEKLIYRSVGDIEAHERRHRKGGASAPKPPLWKNDFHSMARKTVLRELLSRWGILSIDYQQNQQANSQMVALASGMLDDESDDTSAPVIDIQADEAQDETQEAESDAADIFVDTNTGEVLHSEDTIINDTLPITDGSLGTISPEEWGRLQGEMDKCIDPDAAERAVLDHFEIFGVGTLRSSDLAEALALVAKQPQKSGR